MKTNLYNYLMVFLFLVPAGMSWAQPNTSPVQIVCPGTQLYWVDPPNGHAGSTYNWIVTPPLPYTFPDPAFTNLIEINWPNPGVTPTIYSVTVQETASNLCNGPIQMVEVIVNPTPDLLDPSDQQVCNSNLTAPVNFTGSVPGTVYNWVNDDPSIGLAASGTGNIASFVAENLTNFPVIATITVTPSYTNPNGGTTCQGTSQSFTITVYPQVTVTATPSSQSIASGTATNITLTSNTGTATFSWDAALTSGTASGFSGGSGSTIAQTLTNTSSTLATVTYTITPSDNGCPSIPTTVVVTVYPEITAIATPPSQTICSGNTTNIVLSSNTGTATFTWTASLTAGMATGFSNGSGDTIAQTLTNNNNTVALITYTITPNDNGFPGIPIIVVVTVFPEVTVTATPPAETICSSGTTSIALTSNTGNATFSWTAALTSGIASGFSNGSGSTIAQTLSNNSGVVATVTYTITPLANGCPGIPGDVIITISPEVITSPIWHN